VSDSSIGIKVADGSYYPILEHGYTGTKKLTVTTAKDNQDKVQIDLYSGSAPAKAPTRYIGTLVIENIPPATQGEPEIELTIGLDQEGQLSAQASDSSTGESQSFSTTLADLSTEEELPGSEFPDAEFPEAEIPGEEKPETLSFEEPPLTGETYPVGEADRREERVHRRGPNIFLLVLFVILGVLLVAAVAYFVYRSIQGPRIPPLTVSGTAAVAPATPATPKPPAAAVTPEPASAKPAAPAADVTYRIKKGDTLWDISATYYRTPWLYPKLAKANSIKNPDLIFAGTRITIPEN
jgi:LysM repeat protein